MNVLHTSPVRGIKNEKENIGQQSLYIYVLFFFSNKYSILIKQKSFKDKKTRKHLNIKSYFSRKEDLCYVGLQNFVDINKNKKEISA